MGKVTWTPELYEAFCERWLACELTVKQIGKELGITKGAIVGARSRFFLPLRASGIHRPMWAKDAVKVEKKKRRQKSRSGPPLIPAKPVENIADQDIPLEQRKTIMELTSSTCRWPVNDPGTVEFFYCGAHVDELCGPYCPSHRKRAGAG